MFPSKEAAAWYLSGIIDGEGHVTFKDYGNGTQRCVGVVNTDIEIIKACEEAYLMLGIYPVRYDRDRKGDEITPARKHQWELRVSRRDDLETLVKYVHLQAPGKAEKLAAAVDSYAPRPLREEARKLRDEGLSIRAIAEKLDRSYSTVQWWLTRNLSDTPAGRPRGTKWTEAERAARGLS